MNSKQKMFYPLVAKEGGMGLLTVGEDGTLLYSAIDAKTGNPVTVVLYFNDATSSTLLKTIEELSTIQKKYAESRIDNEPAEDSFHEMLEAFKPNGKPN